jgi:hypothetical protein
MLTYEEEQLLKELEEKEAQKVPIMVWQWAAIARLKAAKEPKPEGMKNEDYIAYHRLKIKQWVNQIKLTAEEAAQLRSVNRIVCRLRKKQYRTEYEEYIMGPPIEPVAPMGMYLGLTQPRR